MTRRQRAVHWMAWLVMAALLAAVIGGALYERARVASAAAEVETG